MTCHLAQAPATPQCVSTAGVAVPPTASGLAAASLAVRFSGTGSSGEVGSPVLSIPLLNSLFPDAFKKWQLAAHEKDSSFSCVHMIFLWLGFAMTFLVAISISFSSLFGLNCTRATTVKNHWPFNGSPFILSSHV